MLQHLLPFWLRAHPAHIPLMRQGTESSRTYLLGHSLLRKVNTPKRLSRYRYTNMNECICQWEPLRYFDWPISMIVASVTAQKCAAVDTKHLFHRGGSWFLVCDLVGWHGTAKVVIPIRSPAIFHPTPFVFHLEKQNCSPFSYCENKASQKALREVSITWMGVLWLPQHAVSNLLSKRKHWKPELWHER